MKMANLPSTVPAVVNQHLDAIQHDTEGGLFVGASSLTSRYWMGSFWYFADADLAPNVEKCTAGTELETGINDFKYIRDNLLLLGNDAGAVSLWNYNKDNCSFSSELLGEHDNVVLSVSPSATASKAVSGSLDRRIRIWDTEQKALVNTYTGHADRVNYVACHPTDNDLFLSCSQDGRVLLWDLRKPKPANIVDISHLASVPTSVIWHPSVAGLMVVGTESGDICLQDTRTNTNHIAYQPHKRNVHKMAFHPHKPDLLASVSDDCTVVVTDLSNGTAKQRYRSTDHTDFVRGLSWSPTSGKLYTSAWDFQILSHNISPDDAMETDNAVLNGNA